ncbi:SDR family NAD(P)-dependent oxidoreductase [Streptomyces plumbiresistens]|uniref:SDR family NAD(P)-dependent oxidoreductase n=2 Tax=Streptomyces plumbiresistens TaxID=511811 RepID=A0ABP7SKC0_9ACTN
MGRLSGKVVVVTGAGRGLGREYALATAAEGAKVLVNDVGRELVGGEEGEGLGSKPPGGGGLVNTPPDISVAQSVVDEIVAAGGEAVANDFDVSTVESAANVVYAAADAFGDVHAVINNAGTYHAVDIEDVDDARLDADFGVNVHGAAGTTKAAFEVMKRNGHGGSIVNMMTGFGGFPAGPDLAGYTVAKYGVVAWTLATAAAGLPHGIRANAFCPAALTRQAKGYFIKAGFASGDADTIKRFGPDRMAPLTVFLASDAARDITGRLLVFVPTGFGADAQYVLKETFVAETEGVVLPTWTVDDIEREVGALIRKSDRQGEWKAELSGHEHRYD